MAPDVRETGTVTDIDGVPLRVCTERGRVRLEPGASVVVLSEALAEEFMQIFVSACWEAAHREGAQKAGP